MLTAIIACFTFSFLINPSLDKFSIRSLFVDPEQYQAILFDLWVFCFAAEKNNLSCLNMRRFCIAAEVVGCHSLWYCDATGAS